ncbi:MAG: S-methyl-5-thioribose-1-phosphate isomerase, partial [Candidatus Methanomethylophilaceae archaeon]|nr:S-methyl-5-thioribose-1-phosphate isomerase [Candidatus Methanomethylophilaceae archaeon]
MKVRTKNGTEDIRAVWFDSGKVVMIDQRKLPHEVVIVSFDKYEDVAEAIRNMTTRGAPSIGATAAYGMCL